MPAALFLEFPKLLLGVSPSCFGFLGSRFVDIKTVRYFPTGFFILGSRNATTLARISLHFSTLLYTRVRL